MTTELGAFIKGQIDRRYPKPDRHNPITIMGWGGEIEVTFENYFYARLNLINFRNLEAAESSGRKPFSFEAVLRVIDEDLIYDTVFFDTPDCFSTGNHWKVIGRDTGKRSVILRLCNNSGNSDVRGVSHIEVPEDKSFFTGFDVHYYEVGDKSRRLNLAQVTEMLAKGEDLGNIHDKGVVQFYSEQGIPTLRSSDGII